MHDHTLNPHWIMRLEAGDSPETVIHKAAHTIPHERQRAWQAMELTAFIHFGVNTFSGQEWGSGLEDPHIFKPSELDARQWLRPLAEAGFQQVILTVKHHDGFCLWPSRYTDFSVRGSPWRSGQGDVMRELTEAAHEFGLKVGVYLSPADLHEMDAPGGRYGNGSPAVPSTIPTLLEGDSRRPERVFHYTANDYNRYFLNQLYELLTEYGPIHEVWFDGANPKPGVAESYQYADWFNLVRQLTPEAVIFNGPDVRWVGNEAGIGRETEWSVVPFKGDPQTGVRNLDPQADDLGSQTRLLEGADYLAWSPAEVDVSIRPGWFYHTEEDGQVKSLEHLMEIYYASVGRNGALLLNIPPDRRGRFADPDVQRLGEFGRELQRIFAHDLAQNGHAAASSVMEAGNSEPHNVLDGSPDTFWMAGALDSQPTLVLEFLPPVEFTHIVLQECLGVGQRVEHFRVEAWQEGGWVAIAEGTTIGYKRILRCQPVAAQKIRLVILQSRLEPAIARLGLYHA